MQEKGTWQPCVIPPASHPEQTVLTAHMDSDHFCPSHLQEPGGLSPSGGTA